MTTVAETPASPPAEPRGRWRVLLALVRSALAVGWLVVMVTVLVAGERESSLAQLEQAVASGEVGVVGLAEAPERGDREVLVSWRDGLVRHVTWVVQGPRRDGDPLADDGGFEVDEGYGENVIEGDVRAHLTMLDPDVRFEAVPWRGHRPTLMEWRVPHPWSGALVVLYLATLLGVLTSGRPWRATRWAWFWLVLGAAPVAVPAYLLLAGRAAGVPHPRPGAYRLTGGWAFLLSVAVGTLVGVR
ncbi:hypothetical protein [Nocardioides sp. cx-173]|uniref:hypothetical protein n=1 Tax=Nocardioides sp. cx-173 TaxID=2898796 RepID=UPI001E441682|nr:hypothetical protein [Nocardioides sp. cx-173]MCD4525325.1 hypothetical protein [Nocardioides sp. cx-173]UGB40877.1 hypothetical protein LQ940_16035 [Nocardioides sp. cx-173]